MQQGESHDQLRLSGNGQPIPADKASPAVRAHVLMLGLAGDKRVRRHACLQHVFFTMMACLSHLAVPNLL